MKNVELIKAILRKTNVCALCLIACMLLFSCHHKDFCWDHPHGEMFVAVDYDDDNDPDDIEYLRNHVHATRLMVYHQSSGDMVIASDMDRKVNRLHLDTDTYDFVAHNAGTQNVSFYDREIFYAIKANTRECDILEPLYGSRAVESDIDLGNGERVVIPTDPIWSIGRESVTSNVGDTIRLKAVPLHCRYTYEMRNVEGLTGVKRISSFITGMSEGASLGTTTLNDTPVTVAVAAEVSKDGKSVVGSFMTFGWHPSIDAPQRMGLFVEMENGKRYKLLEGDHFDVSDQVRGAQNRRRVHIVIDGVRIPSESIGGGFEAEVNPWTPGEDLDIDFGFE